MSDEDTMLDKLLAGEKLWNINPEPWRVKQMREVREKIKKEWQEHIDDDRACLIDTGVLLGAINLIDGLLKKGGVK